LVSEHYPGAMTITKTRAKTTEENVKKLENQLQSYMTETSKKLESNDSKMDDLNRKFDVMMEKLFSHRDSILGSPPADSLQLEGSGSRVRRAEPPEQQTGRNLVNNFASRVEFLYFEEGDP